jgi:hypothetical protein
LISELRARRSRGRQPDAVGHGVWKRLHDDCATAARRSPTLGDLMPAARALAEQGQRRWPSETLDVPAGAAPRAHYERLRAVQRAFSDVVYRTRLAAMNGGDARQERLRASAIVEVHRLLDDVTGRDPALDDQA